MRRARFRFDEHLRGGWNVHGALKALQSVPDPCVADVHRLMEHCRRLGPTYDAIASKASLTIRHRIRHCMNQHPHVGQPSNLHPSLTHCSKRDRVGGYPSFGVGKPMEMGLEMENTWRCGRIVLPSQVSALVELELENGRYETALQFVEIWRKRQVTVPIQTSVKLM